MIVLDGESTDGQTKLVTMKGAAGDDGGGRMASMGSQPIFVIAGARSGSTLLRFILDSHPAIACPAETNLGEACASLCRVAGVLCTDKDSGEVSEFGMAESRKAIDSLFGAYLRSEGKRRWCDKSLPAVRNADLLARIWRDAQFVCLFRHCMDMVRSGLLASPWGLFGYGFKPYAIGYPGNSVAALIAYWVDWTTSALRFEEEHDGRCIRVYYEELVTSTDAVAAGLWEFLGELPIPGIATLALSAEHHEGPGDHKIWGTDSIHNRSIGLGRCLPLYLIPPDLLSAANQLLDRLGYVALDTALLAVGSLDALLKQHQEALPGSCGSNSSSGPSDGGAQVVRLVAMEGPREVATAVLDWRSGGGAQGEHDSVQHSAVTVVGQHYVFELVRRGSLSVADAIQNGELRIVPSGGSGQGVVRAEAVRELSRILRALGPWQF
jgi:hypothetical protein